MYCLENSANRRKWRAHEREPQPEKKVHQCRSQYITQDEDKAPDLTNQDKKRPGGCLAKTTENPRYEVTSSKIGRYIYYTKDHAVIGKFMGIWPSKKALIWWINSKWKPRGQVDLKLGSKGLFTTIFTSFEDRRHIFKDGSYFFNLAGLHLHFSTEKFSPEKEDFTTALLWIYMYSLPQEFWDEESLARIGNALHNYVKTPESQRQVSIQLMQESVST
jgi:hypothetical protein